MPPPPPPTPISPDVRAAAAASPRGYLCHRVPGPIALTGRGDDPAWQRVPWTDDFVDIAGAAKPPPRLRTRVKMCHDDRYFYVLAELAEPHVNAAITVRNSVIFRDNDFELFLDPDGDNFNYHEIELNALNTLWELTLPAPYRAGGRPIDPDDLPGLRTAVHVDGTLNDPSDTDAGWTAEVAIPFADLARFGGNPNAPAPPPEGTDWRVNFSRVQWVYAVEHGRYVKSPPDQHESNWVWSPQGVIDMHRPATWGYVHFTNQPPPAHPHFSHHPHPPAHPSPAPPVLSLPARNRLMAVWEAMREHPSTSLDALNLPPSDVPTTLTKTPAGWTATATAAGRTVHVDQSGRLREESSQKQVDPRPPRR